MDCGKVEKLLSLHASGDLEDEHTHAAVSLHLRSCSVCRRLADEYEESLHLLRSACAPPEFDASFYNGIRSTVLKAINNEAAALTPWQLPFQLLRRRLTLAAPVVLLLAAGALAVYIALDETNPNAKHNRLTVVGTKRTGETVEAEAKASLRGRDELTRAHLLAALAPRRPPRVSAARKMPKRDVLHTKAGTEIVRAPLLITQPSMASAERPVSGEIIASTADPAASQEAMRIEIQTGDPNIRIIWFSPKVTE
ncbi:MAG: hypothetical protein H0T92_09155 [Pyrinomonadaceae bacterium]|nr:hypothetical protein [Pyrinomonadaceae bacterium]